MQREGECFAIVKVMNQNMDQGVAAALDIVQKGHEDEDELRSSPVIDLISLCESLCIRCSRE